MSRRRVGLVDRDAHGVAHPVGVHDDRAGRVARRAPDDLDEARRRAEEADLVGVEDRDEGDLGQVDALAQEVDADEDVVVAHAQLLEYLDPLDGLDLGVDVAHLEAEARSGTR